MEIINQSHTTHPQPFTQPPGSPSFDPTTVPTPPAIYIPSRRSSSSSNTCTSSLFKSAHPNHHQCRHEQAALEGVQFLSKPALVRMYLVLLPSTPKGCMKCPKPKQGMCSTRLCPKKKKANPPVDPSLDCHVILPLVPCRSSPSKVCSMLWPTIITPATFLQ